MKRLFSLLIVSIVALSANALAEGYVDAVSGTIGGGNPQGLFGGRISAEHHWDGHWPATWGWAFTGYWDGSVAYWNATNASDNKDIWIGTIAPIIDFEKVTPIGNTTIQPYLEGSCWPALMSSDRIGDHDLGARWTFQDIVGAGVRFGKRQQYDVAYRYVHYSNADLANNNDGIDAWGTVNFTYHFA